MKKISALLTLGLVFYNSADLVARYDFNDASAYENEDDDFFAIDNSLNDISLEKSGNFTFTPQFRSPEDNAAFIYAIFGTIADTPAKQIALLNIPIYQQTSPVRNRPILEEPYTLPYGFDFRNNNSLTFQFFYNSWSKKNFTKTSTELASYFLLGNPLRFTELQAIDDLTGKTVIENLSTSLALFDPASVQENRMGAVLESHVVHNKTILTAQLPILYAERNLYLPPAQKGALESSSLGSMLSTDGVDENDFIYEHIVMDQFGIGDLKFKAMYEMHASDTFDLDLGGFVILPTATALKQGMIGTWFDANNERGYLDLATIDVVSGLTTQNQDDIANFFLDAVNKLSSNILNCPLGNNGHVVLAPSVNFDWYFARRWQFSNDFSVQFPLPANELRFYQKVQNPSEFLNSYNAAFEAGATDPLIFVDFVNTQIQDLFFPYVFQTMVYPGLVFNSTNQFAYEFDTCDFYIGSNFWYQGAERLKSIMNLDNNQDFSYAQTQAAAASAAQEKLFAKVSYNCNSTNYSWSLSAYGDITVWNSGIGNDFTIGISVDGKF